MKVRWLLAAFLILATATIASSQIPIGSIVIQDPTTATQQATVTAANAVKVDGSAVTQPVSGTVSISANQSVNVNQFGGNAVVTGTGAGGLGIPRMTLSNDSSLAANQSVNTAQINGVAPTMGNGISGTGVQRVTLASDSTGQVALATGSATIGALTANQSVNVAQINGVTPLMGNGVTGTGSQRVTIASDNTAFTVNAAESGTWTVQPGNTANTTAWLVQPIPGTTNGLSISRTVAAASTNATNVKASAGLLYAIQASNVNAAARFVHLFNTSGTPTCNASIIGTWIVPGNANGAGTNINITLGVTFGTGIAFCITTANDGTGSVSASDVVLMIEYK